MRALFKKKKLMWASVFILGIILISAIWLYSRKKAQGIVTMLPERAVTVPESVSKAITRYSGEYVTFLYPTNFEVHSREKSLKKPLLETFFASQSDSLAGQNLAVTVQENQGGIISDFTAYTYRKSHPELYAEEKIIKNGVPMALFTKNTPVYEIGAFWTDRKRAISVVFSSSMSLSGMREMLLEMFDTFEWKK